MSLKKKKRFSLDHRCGCRGERKTAPVNNVATIVSLRELELV